uniref:Uncharacterized protein n=1 Tax=Oryza glumipatula TaxID=40148 RepID=A0A0D9YNJ1_9ORYZ
MATPPLRRGAPTRRCAITIVVRPIDAMSRASCTMRSDSVSNALVASSRSRILADYMHVQIAGMLTPNIPGLTLAESVKSGIRKRHAEAYLVVLIPQPLDHLAASPSCRRERRRLRRRDAFAGIPTKPPSPSRRAPLCQPRYAAACLGRGVSPPRLGPSCSQSSAAAAEN